MTLTKKTLCKGCACNDGVNDENKVFCSEVGKLIAPVKRERRKQRYDECPNRQKVFPVSDPDFIVGSPVATVMEKPLSKRLSKEQLIQEATIARAVSSKS